MPTISTVTTRSAMAALSAGAGDSCVLSEAGREGLFRWSADDHSGGAREIANHSGTTVTGLDGGWYGIEKTGGADGVYDAAAVSASGAAGALVLRARRWGALSFEYVYVGANSAPTVDNSYGMTLRCAFSGPTYFIGTGTGGSLYSSSHDWSVYDLIVYRDASNAVKVYSCPRSLVIQPSNIAAQIADHFILRYTYPSTYSGTLYFDSSLYNSGTGAQVQFIDVAGAGDGLAVADPQQGVCVPPASDPTGASGAWLRIIEGPVKVGWFGAKGDGATNDSAALRGAATYINRLGGGTLELEPKTYVVGEQTIGTSLYWAHEPAKMLYFAYCDRKVTLRGNGCTLKCAAGLKYGQFHPTTGSASSNALPFYDASYRSAPFEGAVFAEFNRGDIEIDGVNVDGNLAGLTFGGGWGDSGKQIAFDGFRLYDNTGKIIVRNCKAFRCGLDGIGIRRDYEAKNSPSEPTLVENGEFVECGRQGGTFAGARTLTVVNSKFNRTGKNGYVATQPMAGVDVEPDSPGYADEILFLNCEAIDNESAGFNYATGRLTRCYWKGGRLIGSTAWAFWIDKPGMVFEDALIVGAFISSWDDDFVNGEMEEGLAPKYVRCIFSDDPDMAPGGAVYAPFGAPHGQVRGTRTWFQDCTFDYQHSLQLPETPGYTVMENCRFNLEVTGAQTSDRCEFRGLSEFGGAGLAFMPYLVSASMYGKVLWNGVEQFTASKTHDFGALAAGAGATTTVTVPKARTNDGRSYQASGYPAGLVASARCTADDTVTVTAIAVSAVSASSHTLAVVGTR